MIWNMGGLVHFLFRTSLGERRNGVTAHTVYGDTSIFRSLRLIVDLFHVLYCSGSMCVGVTVWFGWGGVVSLCRLMQSTCFEC